MSVRSFCVSVVLCFCTLCLCGFQAQLNRPVVQETVQPGQTVSGTIEVANQAREPVKLEVYLEDWEYVEGGSGDKTFTPPGTSRWSASSWIHYFPNRLELPPGGKLRVIVSELESPAC